MEKRKKHSKSKGKSKVSSKDLQKLVARNEALVKKLKAQNLELQGQLRSLKASSKGKTKRGDYEVGSSSTAISPSPAKKSKSIPPTDGYRVKYGNNRSVTIKDGSNKRNRTVWNMIQEARAAGYQGPQFDRIVGLFASAVIQGMDLVPTSNIPREIVTAALQKAGRMQSTATSIQSTIASTSSSDNDSDFHSDSGAEHTEYRYGEVAHEDSLTMHLLHGKTIQEDFARIGPDVKTLMRRNFVQQGQSKMYLVYDCYMQNPTPKPHQTDISERAFHP
jgi:hypothetical protein